MTTPTPTSRHGLTVRMCKCDFSDISEFGRWNCNCNIVVGNLVLSLILLIGLPLFSDISDDELLMSLTIKIISHYIQVDRFETLYVFEYSCWRSGWKFRENNWGLICLCRYIIWWLACPAKCSLYVRSCVGILGLTHWINDWQFSQRAPGSKL